jgi:predicted tellurium resistance membrane protein TerC
VSVGILLYMAGVQMIAEDFSHESLALINRPINRVACFVSFFVFAGIMSFIAIWA